MIASCLTIDAYAADYSVNGFLQGNYSFDTDTSNPDYGDLKWAEERAQLKAEAIQEPVRLFFKADVFYDHIDKNAEVELREAYIDLTRDSFF